MKKQLQLSIVGLSLLLTLFFFGKTINKKNNDFNQKSSTHLNEVKDFDIVNYISNAKQKITTNQLLTLSNLENSIKRGDVNNQQITTNLKIANFWKDSIKLIIPYINYLTEAVNLENSEKNLTFAAQLILSNLKGEQDESILNWETKKAVSLFEKALKLNPENNDLKIGLGSCYIYGKGKSSNPTETMIGIQQLLSVVNKDSTNMKAQLVLGVGGFISGQYNKAIDRLDKVVKAQPENIEAIAYLGDAYAASGNKIAAIKCYQNMKKLTGSADYKKEIDLRIKELQ